MSIPHVFRLDEVKALSDHVRVAILDMLSERPMSVQDIQEELRRRGINKSINAIRYHLKVLRDSGLIRLVKVEEVRGGVLKYYAPSKNVYLYEEPEDISELIQPLIDEVAPDVVQAIKKLVDRRRDELISVAKSLKPCPYCYTQHFIEHVILETFKGAVGKALKMEEVSKLLGELHREAEKE